MTIQCPEKKILKVSWFYTQAAYHLKIMQQTHTGKDFGERSDKFEYIPTDTLKRRYSKINTVRLISQEYPALDIRYDFLILFVRGGIIEHDWRRVRVPENCLCLLNAAIQAYNDYAW